MKVDSEVDFYEVLGVPPDASGADIRRAFRNAARMHHPDLNAAASDERMAQINAAYACLGKTRTRQQYDKERARRQPSPPVARVEPPALSFGTIAEPARALRTLYVHNDGGPCVNIRVDRDSARWWRLVAARGSAGPGVVAEFDFEAWCPTDAVPGAVSDEFAVFLDDAHVRVHIQAELTPVSSDDRSDDTGVDAASVSDVASSALADATKPVRRGVGSTLVLAALSAAGLIVAYVTGTAGNLADRVLPVAIGGTLLTFALLRLLALLRPGTPSPAKTGRIYLSEIWGAFWMSFFVANLGMLAMVMPVNVLSYNRPRVADAVGVQLVIGMSILLLITVFVRLLRPQLISSRAPWGIVISGTLITVLVALIGFKGPEAARAGAGIADWSRRPVIELTVRNATARGSLVQAHHACTRVAPVQLQRRSPSGWQILSDRRTGAPYGYNFVFRNIPRAGTYRIVVPRHVKRRVGCPEAKRVFRIENL